MSAMNSSISASNRALARAVSPGPVPQMTRERAMSGMAEAEMQGGHRAHRNPDDVRSIDAEMAHQAGHVLDRVLLGIGVERFGRLGRREAAGVVDDAAVAEREVGDLAGEAPVVVGELVGEDDGVPLTRFLVVERNAVDGCVRHGFEHSCGGAP